MKKILIVIMTLLGLQNAYADNWRHHGGSRYNYNYNYNHNYNYGHPQPRGEWRHEWHNNQLAWWFVVGSIFYLSEQDYLNRRYQPKPAPVIINSNPIYVPVHTQVVPSYQPSYGWYCTVTGRFSAGQYDSCPVPWVSRQY